MVFSSHYKQEARRLAIVAEAKGYLAAKKLQTIHRGKVEWRKHQRRLEAAKLLQQWTRTRLVRLRFLVTVSCLLVLNFSTLHNSQEVELFYPCVCSDLVWEVSISIFIFSLN